MFGTVKDEDFSCHCLRRYQIHVQGHITRAVNFALVIDTLYDLDFRRRRFGVAAKFTCGIVWVQRRGVRSFRDVNRRDLEVILRLSRGMCSKEKSMDSVGLICRPVTNSQLTYEIEEAKRLKHQTYVSLSGNHWHVSVGQSNACVMTRSYRYGAFFFLRENQKSYDRAITLTHHVLYSY